MAALVRLIWLLRYLAVLYYGMECYIYHFASAENEVQRDSTIHLEPQGNKELGWKFHLKQSKGKAILCTLSPVGFTTLGKTPNLLEPQSHYQPTRALM